MFGLSNSAISRLAHTWEVSAICWVRSGPPHLSPESGPCLSWASWLGMGPTPQSSDSLAGLSFWLPHKVRKLYSALERLLVSAPAPPTLAPAHGFFPTAPLPVLGHFLDFQPWVRAWFPLAWLCGAG